MPHGQECVMRGGVGVLGSTEAMEATEATEAAGTCRWPQGGMRPVKMVLRPQVCVCVIERRVAHVETRLPIFAIDIAKSGQKRPFF